MPTKCFFMEATGYHRADKTHGGAAPLYKRVDTGEEMTFGEAPAGAMMYASWLEEDAAFKGDDGHALLVKIPGNHVWYVDSRASNCDSPCKHCGIPYKDHPSSDTCRYEDARPHKCWVRHGTPPDITVDKNGITCGAGFGSIMMGDYHGFLQNGELT